MKILMLTPHYPPEIRSVSLLMSELAEDLAAQGHAVTVITPYPPEHMDEARGAPPPAREEARGVRVFRVRVLPFVKVAPAIRAVTHFTLAGSMAAAGLRAGRHDVILAYSPPLTVGLACDVLKRAWRAPFVFNVQDLYPQALVDLGLVRNPVVLRVLEWLERHAYRHARAITVHSAGNRDALVARGIAPAKVTVIPNWIDTTAVVPGDRNNGYRAELGLGARFVVLFAGVMGYAQDMAIMVEAAARLRDLGETDVTFLLAGDGVRRSEAEALVRARNLDTVRFLPFQPFDRYPQLVSAADCCLVTLQPTVATPVVPSKIAGILAAGRPVLGALPAGDARTLIEQSGGGLCVPPGDAAGLAEAIRRLIRDPALGASLGTAGRRYVEAHLSRTTAAQAYTRLLTTVVGREGTDS
ncbi:MAG TPA: glycosyltransferase family 4 protein [bacterium]|nr:glycosyltransferase family 4 protein [bacterium]